MFDRIGFNRIDDDVFCMLVKARLAYPMSKATTVEYLKKHFDYIKSFFRLDNLLYKSNFVVGEIVLGVN